MHTCTQMMYPFACTEAQRKCKQSQRLAKPFSECWQLPYDWGGGGQLCFHPSVVNQILIVFSMMPEVSAANKR